MGWTKEALEQAKVLTWISNLSLGHPEKYEQRLIYAFYSEHPSRLHSYHFVYVDM